MKCDELENYKQYLLEQLKTSDENSKVFLRALEVIISKQNNGEKNEISC